MKLLRLKITDPAGFRSLPPGFEHYFRTEWELQDELTQSDGFAPFVCAGPNGSGKSNLLEALATIFFQLEAQRVRRSFLPEALQVESQGAAPRGYELEYLILASETYRRPGGSDWARVRIDKVPGVSARITWVNADEFQTDDSESMQSRLADILLPDYVLGYSSGENEILSLPFFKMRFVQYDEYWNALVRQLPYPGRPETRLAYLDQAFSQAILICNLLFQDPETLRPFREEVGIETLQEFRIILRRSIPLQPEQLDAFAGEGQAGPLKAEDIVKAHPALRLMDEDAASKRYKVNLIHLLEGDEHSSRMISALKRCATLAYEDEESDTLILDYWVNEATKETFQENFENSPLALFQAFQVLLTLNLFSVSESLKSDLYRSDSHYVTETVPTLASDERIMRFKFVRFSKRGASAPMMLKDLSDGEHQLLHSLGLCLLFRNTNSLFLLDEPETHFNPDWRAKFITRLRQCLPAGERFAQEMLVTTHTPYLISDSKPEKVLVFGKEDGTGKVNIAHPDYNTLGASINKITIKTFGKTESIGGHAQGLLEKFRDRGDRELGNKEDLVGEIHKTLGDSVEKILLIKAIEDGTVQRSGEA